MTAPDPPIAYIERTRNYYRALGYGQPYRWARFEDVPFHALRKPLENARVGIVTTAAPYQPGKGNQGPGAPYNAGAKFYQVYSGATSRMPDLRISHIAIDRDHTSSRDIGTYFPLMALRGAAKKSVIGYVSPRFHGLPTNRSQTVTLETDAEELLLRCRADDVDAAILVPNCPVCHQSVALAARVLEAAGISTVIMGCALDIVEYVGVPRFLFSDFPLGNSAGRPGDPESQDQTLALALDMLADATAPRTTVRSDLCWPGNVDWKLRYANADQLTANEIARKRAGFDAGLARAQEIREGIDRT